MKVFGIGLNKTGTRSLADAMRTLGFRTLHKGDQATSDLVTRAAADGVPLLRYIGEQYDAYFDVDSIVKRYADLADVYSDARFILTTRELDGWLDSRKKHVEANQIRAERGEYHGSWLIVDLAGWQAEWHHHHAAVRSFFADRPDRLLEMNVIRGDGWEKLAPFLGRPVPREPFPWENRDGAGTYRTRSGYQQLRRRSRGALQRARRFTRGGR